MHKPNRRIQLTGGVLGSLDDDTRALGAGLSHPAQAFDKHSLR